MVKLVMVHWLLVEVGAKRLQIAALVLPKCH